MTLDTDCGLAGDRLFRPRAREAPTLIVRSHFRRSETQNALTLGVAASILFRRSIQLNAAGRFAEARKAATRALEISPEHGIARFNLGVASLLEGDPATALAEFKKASGGRREAGVAMAQHDLGHPEESQKALDELIDGYALTNAYQIAEVYAWRSERDAAFRWLERAYTQHDGTLVQIKFDPLLARIRDDARFAAMLTKMGLPLHA